MPEKIVDSSPSILADWQSMFANAYGSINRI